MMMIDIVNFYGNAEHLKQNVQRWNFKQFCRGMYHVVINQINRGYELRK